MPRKRCLEFKPLALNSFDCLNYRGLLTIGTNLTPIVRFSVTPSFVFVTITIS